MRPRKTRQSGSGDLFRARLDQIINMDHELVRLAQKIDWQWIDGELADRFSDKPVLSLPKGAGRRPRPASWSGC